MTGYKPGFYWKITWRFLAPIFITVVLISSIVSMLIIKPKYSTWDPSLVSINAFLKNSKFNFKLHSDSD